LAQTILLISLYLFQSTQWRLVPEGWMERIVLNVIRMLYWFFMGMAAILKHLLSANMTKTISEPNLACFD